MNKSTKDISENSQAKLEGDLEEATSKYSDINLLDLLIALGQEKVTLVAVTLLAALAGIVISLLTPATYVARTSIMPSQQSSAGNGLAGLGGLAGLAGLSGLSNIAGGMKSSDEMFIALMRSQSVQGALIDQFRLRERYGSKNFEEARLSLNSHVNIMADKKSGLLFIDAMDKDNEFAAQLANAQVKELNVILSRLAVTEAQQKRAYYEQQIIKAQTKIPQLELELKEAQNSSGLEVTSLLAETGTLPGQIAAKELQLQLLSRFATPQNPEIKMLNGEISALRAQLARYEFSKLNSSSNGSDKPELNAENPKTKFIQKATQAYNTLKIQEALLDGFVKQLEIAKLDESKEGPSVQIVDEARAPEIRSKPERTKMVISFTVTGLCLAFLLAAIKVLTRHVKSSDEGRMRWQQLKRAWSFSWADNFFQSKN